MTDAAGFADFSFILETWYIVLTGAFSKSEFKLQPRQRRTDSDLTDHRRSLTASFVKFLTLMSRLSLLYSASSALQCKSKYPWINVTRSEMRRKMTENEGHVSWRNQKLHEFYKSKASKCCQDLTSKYKNLFQVWDFRLYIKTLQFRYFGEKTVSGPIDFHSIFCSCYGSQWDPKPFGYQLQNISFCVSHKKESHWNDMKSISDLKTQEFNHSLIFLFNYIKMQHFNPSELNCTTLKVKNSSILHIYINVRNNVELQSTFEAFSWHKTQMNDLATCLKCLTHVDLNGKPSVAASSNNKII